MRFTYCGENNTLCGLSRKIVEQQEYWALNAILNYASTDLEKGAALFGTSKTLFLERLRKHKLIKRCEELFPFLKLASHCD